MQKRFLFTVATIITLGCCSSAFAQSTGEGAFETWTTKPFERIQSSDHSYLRAVRAAKQADFDRVVFEFEGPIPNYSIKYLPSRYFESERGRERIRIAGNSFVQIAAGIGQRSKVSQHHGRGISCLRLAKRARDFRPL